MTARSAGAMLNETRPNRSNEDIDKSLSPTVTNLDKERKKKRKRKASPEEEKPEKKRKSENHPVENAGVVLSQRTSTCQCLRLATDQFRTNDLLSPRRDSTALGLALELTHNFIWGSNPLELFMKVS